MNGFKQYITSFFSGLRSLLVGMRTTLRVFFRKKTTEQYPENRDTLKMFDRFRGQHEQQVCGRTQNPLGRDGQNREDEDHRGEKGETGLL